MAARGARAVKQILPGKTLGQVCVGVLVSVVSSSGEVLTRSVIEDALRYAPNLGHRELMVGGGVRRTMRGRCRALTAHPARVS
jgi:hypothetical protein